MNPTRSLQALRAKLTELAIGWQSGRVTRPYPAEPGRTPERFRGRPVFHPEKCIGCAGCASNCPAREILVHDVCQELRILEYLGRRCTFCGRCADLCPEKAITMSREFETATTRVGDLRQRIELFMSTCQRCGRCFTPAQVLDRLKLEGYRHDDLAHARWIPRSRPWLDEQATTDDVRIELD